MRWRTRASASRKISRRIIKEDFEHLRPRPIMSAAARERFRSRTSRARSTRLARTLHEPFVDERCTDEEDNLVEIVPHGDRHGDVLDKVDRLGRADNRLCRRLAQRLRVARKNARVLGADVARALDAELLHQVLEAAVDVARRVQVRENGRGAPHGRRDRVHLRVETGAQRGPQNLGLLARRVVAQALLHGFGQRQALGLEILGRPSRHEHRRRRARSSVPLQRQCAGPGVAYAGA
mmetsp:Transcript_9328/g.23908  ORF Transcript_9328/g.23908 Transcript_9328/m.23908 type:complete len:236 (+) Transcript_9328:126-833(+)